MFERFTDQSRRAVVLAQEEATRLNHDHIGTEHVLAGLLREKRGTTARTLEASGITLDAVREQIETLTGRVRSRRVSTSRSRRGPRRASSSRCGRLRGTAGTSSARATCYWG